MKDQPKKRPPPEDLRNVIKTEEEAQAFLREKGIDDDTVLSAGTTSTGSTQRYWQCPLCMRYMDAYMEIDGAEQIASPDRIRCSHCGCSNLNTVEGEFFHPKIVKQFGGPVKATYIPPTDAQMLSYVREGSAMIDDAGLFNEDPRDNEPNWPRSMTAVIAGTLTRLNGTLEKIEGHLAKIANPDAPELNWARDAEGKDERAD